MGKVVYGGLPYPPNEEVKCVTNALLKVGIAVIFLIKQSGLAMKSTRAGYGKNKYTVPNPCRRLGF